MVAFQGQDVNWPSVQLPVTDVKSYEISAPVATHYRPATCEEVGCLPHRNGWETRVPVDSDFERTVRAQARRWASVRREGGEMVFTFAPGTPCFRESQHRVPADRPALFVVRDGDFRGNPTGRRRVHTRPEYWVEDFAEHQQTLADAQKKG